MAKFFGTLLYCLALIALSFALGDIVGETMAPISGVTVQALAARAAQLETRAEDLAMRYEKLEDFTRTLDCSDLLGLRIVKRDLPKGKATACPGCSH